MKDFKHIGEYKCECGRVFTNSQAFSGHKSHCKEHQLAKHGDLLLLETSDKTRHTKTSVTLKKQFEDKRVAKQESDLKLWLSEKHYCERCGKLLTTKYATGRFCNQSCANARVNNRDMINLSISEGVKANPGGWASVEWREQHPDFSTPVSHSKRELEIVDYFKTNFPDDDWKMGFVKEHLIDGVNICPDLHSDKLKVVLEYDGKWHFEDIKGQLEHKQLVDRMTYKWCKDHNYRLIRIDEALNVSDTDIENAIYKSNEDLVLFGSKRYSYML